MGPNAEPRKFSSVTAWKTSIVNNTSLWRAAARDDYKTTFFFTPGTVKWVRCEKKAEFEYPRFQRCDHFASFFFRWIFPKGKNDARMMKNKNPFRSTLAAAYFRGGEKSPAKCGARWTFTKLPAAKCGGKSFSIKKATWPSRRLSKKLRAFKRFGVRKTTKENTRRGLLFFFFLLFLRDKPFLCHPVTFWIATSHCPAGLVQL